MHAWLQWVAARPVALMQMYRCGQLVLLESVNLLLQHFAALLACLQIAAALVSQP
jgi:hypothetical protein